MQPPQALLLFVSVVLMAVDTTAPAAQQSSVYSTVTTKPTRQQQCNQSNFLDSLFFVAAYNCYVIFQEFLMEFVSSSDLGFSRTISRMLKRAAYTPKLVSRPGAWNRPVCF